jgi:elongation factor Ts
MAQIDMRQVKELRDRTQAGLNDCRSALVEAEGDMEAAVTLILKKGLAKSAKRAGSVATEGVVEAGVATDRRSAVLVEVNIQTDFAARNQDFLAFVSDVVSVAQGAPAGADLGAQRAPGGAETIEERRQNLVARLGENVTVRRWEKVALGAPGLVHSYVHLGGKIGVLLAVQTDAAQDNPQLSAFVENTAMQIAAMSPLYLELSEVPESAKAQQRELFKGQLQEEGKPEASWAKIVEGKLVKWQKEVCLLEQQSVLDAERTVEQVRTATEKELGKALKVVQFVRFERGEGLAPVAGPDFADEARRMAGQG